MTFRLNLKDNPTFKVGSEKELELKIFEWTLNQPEHVHGEFETWKKSVSEKFEVDLLTALLKFGLVDRV